MTNYYLAEKLVEKPWSGCLSHLREGPTQPPTGLFTTKQNQQPLQYSTSPFSSCHTPQIQRISGETWVRSQKIQFSWGSGKLAESIMILRTLSGSVSQTVNHS